MKIDLTKYSKNAVLQLLKGNDKINKMLPTCTKDEFLKHLDSKYNLTREQKDYLLNKLIF